MQKNFTRLIFGVVLASSLSLASNMINQGWNLKGATSNVNPSSIGCAKYIWSWQNGSWKLYVKNPPQDNFGYAKLNSIDQGDGFWVYSDNGGCSVSYQSGGNNGASNDIPYHAYGLNLFDKKSDSRYLVSGNGITFDGNNTFVLTANRLDNQDSRTRLYARGNGITSSEATFRFDTNGTTHENKAQLMMCGFDVNSTNESDNACIGVDVSKNSVTFWYEADNSTGSAIGTYDTYISQHDYIGQDITLQEETNGTQIIVNILNDSGTLIKHFIYDTSNNSIPLKNNATAHYVAVTAKVLDNKDLTSSAAQTSVITLKDFKVIRDKHTRGALVDTISFPSVGHYIFLDIDDGDSPSFEDVTISGSVGNYQISDKSYEYNGTAWSQKYENFSIDSNGNIITPERSTIKIKPYETREVESIDGQPYSGDIHVTHAIEVVVAQSLDWYTDTWNWDNPKYYDSNTSQQTAITDIDSLIYGFTMTNMRNNINDMTEFLNPNGDVVLGKFSGYKQNCTGNYCKNFARTNSKIGSWYKKGDYLYIDVPEVIVRLKVTSDSGVYHIEEGDKDKVGSRWYDTILTGSDATVDTIKGFIEAGDSNQTN